MSDVLKQVEDALEDLLPPTRDVLTEPEQRGYAALNALRGLEWKPIDSDMVFTEKVSVGKWFKLLNRWKWVTSDGWQSLKAAKMGGYTHFCRPVLPTPPKREVE